MIDSIKIIEDPRMLVDGEPYEQPRTWHERLFTRPWRPLRATDTVVPKVPDPEILKSPNGTWIMHPAVAAELKAHSL